MPLPRHCCKLPLSPELGELAPEPQERDLGGPHSPSGAAQGRAGQQGWGHCPLGKRHFSAGVPLTDTGSERRLIPQGRPARSRCTGSGASPSHALPHTGPGAGVLPAGGHSPLRSVVSMRPGALQLHPKLLSWHLNPQT